MRLAALQYWVITWNQLIAAGIGRGSIARRLQNGRLHARYRGVYLVGRPTPELLR